MSKRWLSSTPLRSRSSSNCWCHCVLSAAARCPLLSLLCWRSVWRALRCCCARGACVVLCCVSANRDDT